MKKHWWKVLAVLILIFVFVIGLLAPLNIGITSSTPTFVSTGETITLEVEGYNTYFTKGENVAWLKLDSANSICATNIEVIDDVQLKVTYQIPNQLPVADKNAPVTLVINNTEKGYAIYPDALSIKNTDNIDSTNTATWTCNNQVLTEVDGFDYPFRNVLMETIRNLYFHVPFWFGMIILFTVSMVYSIKYLRNPMEKIYDIKSVAFIEVGLLFGFLGIITGGIWAQYTWGAFWSFDIKQNMSAIALLMYMAYFVLRSSFDDEQQKARLSAIYNIFAFACLIPLLFVIPRLYDSLHPGNGGNPGFGGEDLDNTMRMVFYPAVIGWTLLGVWFATIITRVQKVRQWWIDSLD
jgi:heme exporter protein C